MSKFSDPACQRLYDLYRANPPVGRGNGLKDAFQNGVAHPDKADRYTRGSFAYAAWAAGRDHVRASIAAGGPFPIQEQSK